MYSQESLGVVGKIRVKSDLTNVNWTLSEWLLDSSKTVQFIKLNI